MRSPADPLVIAFAHLIHTGEISNLQTLLADHPELAGDRFGDTAESRTALHIATDWPGHYPRGAETITLLVRSGSHVNGRFTGAHRETPLHWAASSNDLEAIEALLNSGADIEANGAVLTGGTALSDAVVFAQWDAARLLVERGARMTIWQAATLGEIGELERFLKTNPNVDSPGDSPENSPHESLADSFQGNVTNACWHACRGGQLAAVQMLVDHGADIDWLGYESMTSRQAGLASGNPELIRWLTKL